RLLGPGLALSAGQGPGESLQLLSLSRAITPLEFSRRVTPKRSSSQIRFSPLPFPPTSAPFARALTERDYTDPTAVQSAVLAPEAAGRDLLVSAQTGSGKTVAFGLSIAATLLDAAETLGPAGNPLALIVAPTR